MAVHGALPRIAQAQARFGVFPAKYLTYALIVSFIYPPEPPPSDRNNIVTCPYITHFVPTMKEIRSSQDLQTFFQDAFRVFDGRETEQNWKARDNLCCDMRNMSAGDVPKTYTTQYANGVKSILDGINSCVISERTQLSNHGCELVQALAKSLTSLLHPMLDILFPPLIRLCAAARKISSKMGNMTVLEIITHSRTYTPRLLQHVSSACTDKNDAPRIYAAVWLETLLGLYGHQIEQTGGLNLLEKSLKLGLNDAHVEARENSRKTYWLFAKQWPSRADDIMATLDAPKQKALSDHPSNPNKTSSRQPDRPRPGSSLAEMRAQAKKDLKAKKEAADKDDGGFIINLDGTVPGVGLDKKKAPTKLRPESQQSTHHAHSQRPLQPIHNPNLSTSISSNSAQTTSHSKSGSLDLPKGADLSSSTASQRSRPLMAAPVRRAVRVVSNTKLVAGRPVSREEMLPAQEATPAPGPASRSEAHHSKIATPVSRPQSRDHTTSRHAKASSRTIPLQTVAAISPQPPSPGKKHIESRARNTTKHDIVEDPRQKHAEQENIQRIPHELAQKQSSRKGSPDLQAQIHLQNYIKKIRKFDLSVLGFGRIKRLVENHGNALFDTERPFHDLMLALLFAIDSVGQRPAQDLKDQNEMYILSHPNGNKASAELTEDYRFAILGVIKAALAAKPAYFTPYHQRTIALLLTARGKLDNEDHKVLSLEETAATIVQHCDQPAVITTVLDTIDSVGIDQKNSRSPSDSRVLIMGLRVLSDLFPMTKSRSEQLSTQISRATTLSTECMHTFDPRVRKATVELLVVLQNLMGEKWLEDSFGAEEGTMNMVAYYANQKTSGGELVAEAA